MLTVLLLGGEGLGTELAPALTDAGHRVVALGTTRPHDAVVVAAAAPPSDWLLAGKSAARLTPWLVFGHPADPELNDAERALAPAEVVEWLRTVRPAAACEPGEARRQMPVPA